MKRFLLNIVLFSSICGASILAVFMLADETSDAYYIKVATPKQNSLILGSSKAAQSMQPSVFDSVLNRTDKNTFYNYSFNLYDSPFGPVYLNSIEKKVDPDTRDGIFVVTVDPWSISCEHENIDDTLSFREVNGCLAKTPYVDIHPNLFYLLNAYKPSYYQILFNKKFRGRELLKKDGWLEIRISMDSVSVAKRTIDKIDHYKNVVSNIYHYAPIRLEYLDRTVAFLQKHGTVYLVRLPVTEEIFLADEQFMPSFDKEMEQIAEKYNLQYLNYRNKPHVYDYTDGNHLYKTSGAVVSAEIANWILEDQKKKSR